MSLDLDERQRAMLQEMHIRVWWPVAAPAAAELPQGDTTVATRPAPVAGARAAPARPVVETAPAIARMATPMPPAARSDATPVPDGQDMPALAQAVAACADCGLCEGRRQAVFAAPTPARQTDWMVVGDPPTGDDERAGNPFAGVEGELLDNMLRAVQCSRTGTGAAGAWLTHVVKCRPAAVRNPEPDELALCARYLRREVALVRPRVILATGRFAALSLLSPSNPDIAQVPPGKLRGRLHQFEGVPVVVTYSPARLLRAPQEKAGAWADLCLARSVLPPPPEAAPA